MSDQLQKEKIKILELLERFKFLTPRQIALFLSFLEKENFSSMLEEKLISAIQIPFVIPGQDDGSVFCLSRKGAEVLALYNQKPVEEIKYITPSKQKRSLLFLEHTICLNEFVLVMEKLSDAGIRILQFEREPKGIFPNVFVRSARGVECLSLIPDAVFKTEFADKEHLFLVEIDRGTMNLARMRQKFRAYVDLWKDRFMEKKFNLKNLRVLVVCPGERRVKSFIEEVRKIGTGMGLFWLTAQEKITLDEPERFLGNIWRTAKNEKCRLFNKKTKSEDVFTL